MKKSVSTIVGLVFMGSILSTSAYAGDQRGRGCDSIRIPLAILSTVATVVSITQQPPRQIHSMQPEQHHTVIIREPQRQQHHHTFDRGHQHRYHKRDYAYDVPRHRSYRNM